MSVASAQVVGFTLHRGLDERACARAQDAQQLALGHFPHLHHQTFAHHDSTLTVWGHGELATRVRVTAANTLQVLVGSPHGDGAWCNCPDDATAGPLNELPWEGRCVLLQVDGRAPRWDAWCDWVGSIPVVHARCGAGWIASTLEPAVVAATGATAENFLRRGIYALLAFGHCLGNDTIFRNIQVLPPDCQATWTDDAIRTRRLDSVQPSDDRWDAGWNPLRDEAYERTRDTIGQCMAPGEAWILPLSGGMDSRLIAGVGSALGVQFDTYTYGDFWNEATWARQVARTLRLPWHSVDLGQSFHGDYAPLWADWFGSLVYFHGMYQMVFLNALPTGRHRRIASGFLGDPLAGNHTEKLLEGVRGRGLLGFLDTFDVLWSTDELHALLRTDGQEERAELEAILRAEDERLGGADHQRMLLLDLWHRQRRLIFYQPMMYNYFGTLAAPFMQRDYARFWFSLPRALLSQRRLQNDMLARHMPDLAAIGGSFSRLPLRMTLRYHLREKLAGCLPARWRCGPLREWHPRANTIDEDCFRHHPEESCWPVSVARDALGELFDRDVLARTERAARGGDLPACLRIAAVQPLAWRCIPTPAPAVSSMACAASCTRTRERCQEVLT